MDSANNTRFVIKICGIANPEDGVAAADAGASAVGLNFYPRSPRYVSLGKAREIAAALPSSVLRVGIFVNPAWDDLVRTAASVPLDVVQVHGILQGPGDGLRLWKALAVDHRFNPNKMKSGEAEAYLLDTPAAGFGGSGQTFDWSRIMARSGGTSERFLVAGGLDGSNVAAAIAATKPWGVDACSRLEIRPGQKDAHKVRDFVDAARQAFEALAVEESRVR
jgi:phosphoribosylanthranilate isomerase